jgi:hypothetical protein
MTTVTAAWSAVAPLTVSKAAGTALEKAPGRLKAGFSGGSKPKI